MSDWRRNYRAVWVSLFTTSMGLMAFLPVLTLHVGEAFAIHDPDERLWWGGLIYGAAPLTAAVLGPVWGALGDRVGKKPMAIRANLAIALTTAFMPLAPSPIALLVLRAVQGAFAGYVAPAMALVTQDAPPEHQGVTIGRLQAAMALGSGLGPIVGGEITLQFGRPALFYVTSVLTALAALVLWRSVREVPPPAAAPGPFLREFTAATAQLLRNRVFFVLLLLILVLRLGQNMLEPFVAPFVTELGAPAWMESFCATPEQGVERTIGVAFAVLAVAQVLFTPLWGRLADRHGPLRCLAVLAVALGAVLAATVLVRTPNQFLAARSLAACFMAGSMTLAYAAASRRVVAGRRTLAFSLVQSCMQFGFALGPQIGSRVALLGAATQHADLRLAFAVAGAMCALSGAGMIALRRRSAGAVDQQAQPIGGEGI